MPTKKIILESKLKGAGKTKQGLKGIDGGLKSLGKSAIGVAGAYFGATGLISGIKSSVNAFKEQELAEKKLATALGKTSHSLLKQASALQQVSNFGDETTIKQMAFLASLDFTEQQIKDIIPVAMDLAAATGMSLESAVRNTAKTFSGLSGELGEMVPQLRDLTKEEMRNGDAVKVMAQLFGGASESDTNTLFGAVNQAEMAIGDLSETFASLLAPSIKEGAIQLKNFIVDIDNKIQKAKFKALDEDIKALAKESFAELNRALLAFEESGGATSTQLDQLEKNVLSMKEKIPEASFAWDELLVMIEEARGKTGKMEGDDNPLATPFVDFLENQAPILEAGYDQFWDSLIELDMHGKDRRELVWGAMKSSAFKMSGEFIKEKIKEGAILDTLRNQELMKEQLHTVKTNALKGASAVAGYLKSLFETMPWFVALPMAGVGAAALLKIFQSQMSEMASGASKGVQGFARGGDFVTDGPQMIMVGDNPGGREHVQVTPISSPNINGPQGGVTLNFNGPITNDDYVRDFIIPEISKATQQGLA